MSSSKAVAGNIATVYSAKATVDVFKNGAFGYAVANGIIATPDVTTGNRGSTFSFPKASILTGTGTGSSQSLQGREESINNNAQTMIVDEFCHAVLNPTDLKIEKYETYLEWDDIAQKQLTGFVISRKDAGFFQQLAGAYSTTISVDSVSYSGSDRLFVAGLNTVTAPTTNRIIRAAAAATDQALTSSDTMTLGLIDSAIVLLEENYPSVEPDDQGFLHLFVSHAQGKALAQQMSASAVNLATIGYNEIASGGSSQTLQKSGFSGNKSMTLIGVYRNVKIWACKRVARGVHGSTSAAISTVQRAILCGQNAGTYVSYFGKPTAAKSPAVRMSAQLQDHDRWKSTSIHTIDGIVKNVNNSEDEAVVVISTYGA